MNTCKDCGEHRVGDGYTSVLHCLNASEALYEFAAPDEGPFDCGFVDPEGTRAGLHSRKDTRDARVCLAGVGPEGRPYVIDGPSAWDCHLEEINHIYWLASGRELEKNRND